MWLGLEFSQIRVRVRPDYGLRVRVRAGIRVRVRD